MACVIALLGVAFGSSALAEASPPPKLPENRTAVIVDTDIGTEIDDALALALVLASPELDVRAITTVGSDAHTRAGIVCQMLDNLGVRGIAVVSGEPPRAKPELAGQFQFGLRARQQHPVKQTAVEFLCGKLMIEPGKLTIIALGPLTNIAALFQQYPQTKAKVERLIVMGGSLKIGYSGQSPAEVEWNIRGDIPAARDVFSSGVPLTVVPLDASATLKLEGMPLSQLLLNKSPLPRQVQSLFELSSGQPPVLYDPAAVAVLLRPGLFQMEDLAVSIDEQGMMRIVDGKPTARVAMSVDRDSLLKWYLGKVTDQEAAWHVYSPGPVPLPAMVEPVAWQPAEPQRLPARVHVFEDYETEIERRWWLAGVPETKNVPPGSTRACRAVLCRDFDDRHAKKDKTWRAVIFNPVPGPPMGANTRLNFRCWLRGADTVRVQIYSLSNGYHRQLPITGLPQQQWQAVNVDMTQLRRPFGPGGPLSENERIDDIQFYVEPDAELLIDDIVLYEAAPAAEQQPFPTRFAFTGGFDTGKQGVEWPGMFEIVPHQPPRTWKAAQAVPAPDNASRIVRIDLRGERLLKQQTRLRFAYHLTGVDRIDVEFVGPSTESQTKLPLTDIKQNEWSVGNLAFTHKDTPHTYRELVFRIPPGGQLQVDDVLLYEP